MAFTEKSARWRKRHPEQAKQAARDHWARMSPERKELEHRKTVLRRYGLTIADFERMEREQDGLCAICLKPPTKPSSWGTRPRLVVDHNHTKGKKAVRQLLCVCCNLLVGYCGESTETLQRASDYLRRHGKA